MFGYLIVVPALVVYIGAVLVLAQFCGFNDREGD